MNKCKGGCTMSKIGGILVIIGGLNWGLYGIGMLIGTNLNVVNLILGSMPTLEAIVYVLVGIATVMVLVGCKCSKCKSCMAGGAAMGGDAMKSM